MSRTELVLGTPIPRKRYIKAAETIVRAYTRERTKLWNAMVEDFRANTTGAILRHSSGVNIWQDANGNWTVNAKSFRLTFTEAKPCFDEAFAIIHPDYARDTPTN